MSVWSRRYRCPSIFNIIRSAAALERMWSTLDLSCEDYYYYFRHLLRVQNYQATCRSVIHKSNWKTSRLTTGSDTLRHNQPAPLYYSSITAQHPPLLCCSTCPVPRTLTEDHTSRRSSLRDTPENVGRQGLWQTDRVCVFHYHSNLVWTDLVVHAT